MKNPSSQVRVRASFIISLGLSFLICNKSAGSFIMGEPLHVCNDKSLWLKIQVIVCEKTAVLCLVQLNTYMLYTH